LLRATGLLRGLLAFSLPFAAVCSAFPLRGNKPPQTKRKNNMNKTKNNPETLKAAPTYHNHVRLIGFLGDKPTQYEKRAIFSVATKTSWPVKDSDQWDSHTEWHRCVAWDELAKAIKPLAKGDYVCIDGELRSSSYDRELPVVGGGTTIVPTKVWEIRARVVRKLAYKKKPVEKNAKAEPLKAAA
jgi:single-strand DNA-binding protein